MLELHDFTKAVFDLYETHYGDLCPFSHQDLSDVFDILNEDLTPESLEEAFNEAELEIDDSEAFFNDLAVEMRELVPESF